MSDSSSSSHQFSDVEASEIPVEGTTSGSSEEENSENIPFQTLDENTGYFLTDF